MPNTEPLDMEALAKLSQVPPSFLTELFQLPELSGAFLPGDLNLHFRGKFQFIDALAIEVARQMSDDSGILLKEAVRLVSYTGAVTEFIGRENPTQSAAKADSDFWLSVLGARASWGDQPRGKWPVTGFGPGECWHRMHFTGAFDAITTCMLEWMQHDEAEWPDSDPARIFMANVSAADRRLRKRAGELGITVPE